MTFLKSYQQYAGAHTDAPGLFHLWTGVSLLSSAIGNGAWCWAWGRRICPNMFIILLAPSGILRKTTALNIGRNLMHSDGLGDRVWSAEWSFEALLEMMASRPAGTMFISEFKRFAQAMLRDYASGAKELLVDTYDNPPLESRLTKGSGEIEIRFPAPSLLAATTLDWFEASLQKDDVGGGLLSRMLIIPARERGEWRGIGTTRSDADAIVRDELRLHLRTVREKMQGELDLSEITTPFNDWLREYEDSWQRRMIPELAGTIARAGANALKLSIIFQADVEPSMTVSLDAFERARQAVEFTNEQAAQLVSDGLGQSRDARDRRKVAELVKGAYPEPLEHAVALRNSHLSADAFKRHATTLAEANEIEIVTLEGGRKAAKAYRWMNGATPE